MSKIVDYTFYIVSNSYDTSSYKNIMKRVNRNV